MSMRTISRPFNLESGDFALMWHLLKDDYRQRRDAFVWLFSRLEYWRYGIWHERKYVPSFYADNARLWLDAFGGLLGFALSEEGDGMFTVIVRPGYDYLYEEILAWTAAGWRERGGLRTEVHSLEAWKAEHLEHHGFADKGPVAVTRRYDPAAASAAGSPPPGFRFADMREARNYEGKLVCTRNAFRHREVEEFDHRVNGYFVQAPSYDPYLDLSLVDEAGRHVSACIGWADYDQGTAEIETICTHSDFRRHGYAETVVRECLRRLHGRGIRQAYITGYSTEADGLYAKLGPVAEKAWRLWQLV